jgi:hypothetical protein
MRTFDVPTSVFDPRDLLPGEVSLGVLSSRTGAHAADALANSLAAAVDQGVVRPAAVYPESPPPVVEVTVDVPLPAGAGEWTLLWRLADRSTSDPARVVHMEIPTGRLVGDDSFDASSGDPQVRWVHLGFLETQ